MLDGNARPLLDRVARDDARVIRRPAGDDDDAPEVADLLVVEAEPLELEPPVADPVADRLLDRVRLLVDLLEHERLEAALLGRLDVPVDLVDVPEDLLAVDRPEGRPLRPHGDDLVVLDDLDALRVAQERGRRGREEHLPLADAHEQRALVPRADEQLRVLAVEDDEGEVPLQLGVGGAHSRDEVALVVPLDEVGDHLGVGLGRELVALLEERRLQLAVVLDDPVEDEVDVALEAPRQRVRVLGADAAVRRPARVPDAGRRQGLVVRRRVLELAEVADGADLGELPVLDEREAGGVIAAVLEPLEAVQEDRLAIPASDVSDDPAHVSRLSPVLREFPP